MAVNAAWAGPNVLLLWDDLAGTTVPDDLNANTRALIGALQTAGIGVTFSDTPQAFYNGFNPMPDAYDVVIHLNGGSMADPVMPTSGVNVLVSYVRDRKGGYIGSENNGAQMALPFAGLSLAMEDLTLVDYVRGYGPGPLLLTTIPGQESHPVLRDVTSPISFTSGHRDGLVHSFSNYPAQSLMTDADNNDAVVVRSFNTGRVVSFHHMGNTGGAATLSDPNVQKLYVNSVLWADVHPPTVSSITREMASPHGAGDLQFRVTFSEGVTGVDATAFAVTTNGTVDYVPSIIATPITDTEYIVVVPGVMGDGTLRLDVVDNDTIHDLSYNANPLGGPGAGNGNYSAGEVYDVQGTPPQITGFLANPLTVPVGYTSQFTIVFSKAMDTSVFPDVSIQTANNAVIKASPVSLGGDGAWTQDDTYQVSMDRFVIQADSGPAPVSVSGAKDPVGNVMAADATHYIALVTGGMHITAQPPSFALVATGDDFMLHVGVEGNIGAASFEWYRESAAKAFQPVGGNSAYLPISPVKTSDAGTYYCVISDSVGSIQSNSTLLVVGGKVPAVGLPMLLVGVSAMVGGFVLRRKR
jgi:hypothetical protein